MSTPGAPERVVASCRLDGVSFAVAADDVLRLLPRPDVLIDVPRRAGALQGAFMLHHLVVPVVDLRRWLPWPGDPATRVQIPDQLLVLRRDGRTLAVAIDGVEGLHKAVEGVEQRIAHAPSADDVFSGVVELAGSAHAGSPAAKALALLDVDALMRLGQAWSGDAGPEAGRMPASARERQPGEAGRAHALLDGDGQRIAIAADHLRAVVPMPSLQQLWPGDPSWLGVARWRGRDVPVRRLAVAREAAPCAEGAPLLAVVEHRGLCLGIAVQSVRDIRRLDLAAAQPLASPDGVHDPALSRLLLPDGSPTLVVDVGALVAGDPLASISAIADEARTTSDDGPRHEAHVVVQAGAALALPISRLLEISEPPAAWVDPSRPVESRHHVWRQQIVPIRDLRALQGQGRTLPGPGARLVIVRSRGGPVGLLVEALLHLLPARTCERAELRGPDGRVLRFVVHHDGCERMSFEVLEDEEASGNECRRAHVPAIRGGDRPA